MTLPSRHPGLAGAYALLDLRDHQLGSDDDAAQRLALLAAVAAGTAPPTLRLVRPGPTAAFSRRDALLPGFPAARAAAARHGFAPVVRPVGGRMAPQHRGCVVLDVVGRAEDPVTGSTARFEAAAGVVVDALRQLDGLGGPTAHGAPGGSGSAVRVGPLPREYCPGEHSVHLRWAGGATKVAGTAQRQVRRAWLVSVLVVVEDAAPLRAVTADAYAALGLDLDPATVGAVADRVPGATTDRVADLLLDAFTAPARTAGGGPGTAGGVPPAPGRVAP